MIGLHLDGGQACVQVFFIRANQNWGNRDYYPRTGSGASKAEIMEGFVGQFYENKDPPRQIILSDGFDDMDLMAEALSEKAGRKVELLLPQRGEKAELVAGRAAQRARKPGPQDVRNGDAGQAAERAGRGV